MSASPAASRCTRTARIRRRGVVSGLCLAILATGVALDPARAREPSSLDFSPLLDQGLLGQGRQAYRERRNPQRALEAYDLLKRNLADNPADPVAAWHLAMSCYYLGMQVFDDKEDRKRVFAEGRDYAREALERDPDCAPCHLLTAVNHALWAKEVGIFRTLVGLPWVRHHLKRAAELEPAFGGAAAHRILANISQVLPRVFGGGRKRARKEIEKAIEIAPDEPLNYEFLADLLIDDYHDPKQAVSVARRGLRQPAPAPEYVESVEAFQDLQEIVQQYGRERTAAGG